MNNVYVADEGAGRVAALAVWALYLLSIRSSGLLALLGVIVAYVARDGASSWARTHFDAQIALWWTAALWAVGLAVAGFIALALTLVLIGFPLLWLVWLIGALVAIWFTVRSAIGLYRLLNRQDA